jgi:ABC-type phosphate/phosphonate transport system substrate-binding protein
MIAVRLLAVAAALVLLAGGCASSSSQKTSSNGWHLPDTAKQPEVQSVRSHPLLETQGFAILDFRARRDEYSRVSVIGEVKNTGFAARTVELQATLRDESGRVLAVGHFYPTSTMNIQPNETWPFGYSFGRQDGVAKAELRIVGAFRTIETVNVASEAR